MTTVFADLTGRFQLFVAGGEDFQMAVSQAILRGDVADGRVQAGGVVMVDEVGGDAFGIGEGQRGLGPDGLFLERAVA